MAAPQRNDGMSYAAAAGTGSSSQSQSQSQPTLQGQDTTSHGHIPGADDGPAKKKRHRAGKKRRARRQSFIAPSDTTATEMEPDRRPSLLDTNHSSAAQTSFYRLKSAARSNTSLESEALLDHRSASFV
jgi:magnesium transporter